MELNFRQHSLFSESHHFETRNWDFFKQTKPTHHAILLVPRQLVNFHLCPYRKGCFQVSRWHRYDYLCVRMDIPCWFCQITGRVSKSKCGCMLWVLTKKVDGDWSFSPLHTPPAPFLTLRNVCVCIGVIMSVIHPLVRPPRIIILIRHVEL